MKRERQKDGRRKGQGGEGGGGRRHFFPSRNNFLNINARL